MLTRRGAGGGGRGALTRRLGTAYNGGEDRGVSTAYTGVTGGGTRCTLIPGGRGGGG